MGIYMFFGNFENFRKCIGIYMHIYTHAPLYRFLDAVVQVFRIDSVLPCFRFVETVPLRGFINNWFYHQTTSLGGKSSKVQEPKKITPLRLIVFKAPLFQMQSLG